MKFGKLVALAAPLSVFAFAAHAGGAIAPVVEVAAPVVETVAPVGNWQGGYAGVTLGYAFSGKDRYGIEVPNDFQGDIGTMKLSGGNAGLRIGYRWQKDNWVFGPELAIEGGSIKDSVRGTAGGIEYEGESKIKNVISLRGKVGYTVRPDMLIYGIAGVARADVSYKLGLADDDKLSADYKKTGYVVGLGVEKQLNDRWSVTGEYEYANFGKETREFEDVRTEATPKYNNIKLGLNFKF